MKRGSMKALLAPLAVGAVRISRHLGLALASWLIGLQIASAAVDPLPFVETPAASGFFTAATTNTFTGTGVAQADDWTLDAEAGDRLTARIEASVGNSRPRLRLLNPASQTIASVDGDTAGVAEFHSAVLTAPGTYRVRVYTDHQVSDYRLRVDLARAASLEAEPNDTTNTASVLAPRYLAGSYQWRVGGTLVTADSAGDYFALGTLDSGNAVATDLFTGPHSALQAGDAVVALFRLGQGGAVFSANTNFSSVITVRDDYFIQVSSAARRGLLARYFLTVTVTDSVPPVVQAVTLPAEGATGTDLINSIAVTFSEPMRLATLTNSANVTLRQAGLDAAFGTADDVVYPLVPPGSSASNTVTFALQDGPLQAGVTRFSLAATVTDRAGNPLTPAFTRTFTQGRLGTFQFENRSNDSAGGATSLSLTPSNTPDGSLSVEASYGVGSNPFYLLAGRFDGDALADVAVANLSSGNVSVLLGKGDGSFRGATNYPAGNGPIALATGDVNGDALADLLVANHNGHNVSVLLGRGDGSFGSPTNYSTGNNPRSVALGDLNGDGRLDFVTANEGAGGITIRLGNGDGTFGDGTNVATGGRAFGVGLGHLNGDGYLDAVVANYGPNTVSVLLGNGDGTFAAPVSYGVGNNPRSVALGDYTGDGVLDVAVLDAGSNTVSLLGGNGDGTLREGVAYGAGSSDPYQVLAGDWNGDGRLDVAVASYGNSRVCVLLNNGAGGFEERSLYSVGGNPISVVASDLDGDGRVELVTANYHGNNATVLRLNRTQLLVEDPAGSGIRTGAGRGNLSSTEDVDYWSFTGRAGDRLVVGSETAGHVANSGLYWRVERGDGGVIRDFYPGNNGTGQSAPLVLPVSGSYLVRVSNWHQYRGEYRLRVTLAPAPWQLEAEDNNTVGQANAASFAREGPSQQARMLGYIRYGDPADVFGLGNLSVGAEVRLGYRKPVSSGLSGVLSVLDSAGNVVASAPAGSTNLTHTIPAGGAGAYYARMQAGPPGYAGAVDSAVYVDGGDDYVDVGAWSAGTQWTLEAWVRPVSVPGGRRTIVGGYAECLDWGITLQEGRFGLSIRPPGGCSQTISGPTPASAGDWYHVVGTCDGLTARLYVNGQFAVSGPVQSQYTGTAAGVRIGSEVCCGGNSFPGYIDEVAIWNRALTGAEVLARLAGPLAGNEIGLLGYWRFNEAQGETVADASGQGRTGTLRNGAGWVSLAPAAAGEPGLMTQYLLSLTLSDLAAPTILADTLPVEGGTVFELFDRFTLTFSEDMEPVAINAPASYELRSSGLDGQLDTADDLLWPVTTGPAYSAGLTASYAVASGALPPGSYRFRALTTLEDRAGNRLAAAWTRQFNVAQVAGFNTELEPNNTRETATPLLMSSTQPDLISGAGRAYLRDGSDLDFWSFEAQAGDAMVLAAEAPGNPGSSGLQYLLYGPTGGQLLSATAANNGLLQTSPLALTNSGLYTVRVSVWHGYYQEYRLRVSLFRNGLPVELEPNDGLASATMLTYTASGNTRTAAIAGYTQQASDLDYYNLGVIEAGKTVFLRTRLPASSPLAPVVSLYNAANVYMAEAGNGRPSDGVAEVRIEQTGVYYALVRAGAGSAGLMSEYLLDVPVLPTADVVIPNLQVTQLTVPVTTGLRSGQPFTFAFTVANVGSLATQVGLWFDRAVLSADAVMDANDWLLGLYQRTGALTPGQSYRLTNTVNLPDAVSGPFYLIVKADYTDTVNEFLLEGDNETATENPFTIALADYPDLKIEDLQLTGPDASQTYRLSWTTFNRGTAAAPAGFKERVRVRNQTSGATPFDQTYTVATALAPNESITRQVDFTTAAPGTYGVEVTTDSDREIFEYDGVSVASAEANTATTTFSITQFYTLTLNAAPPGAGTLTGAGSYPAGTSVTVTATPIVSEAPYVFENWVEGGVVRSANPSYTFTLNRATTLTAVFGLPGFEISVSNSPPAAGTVLGGGVYAWGSTNVLTAQPAFGYKFSHWTEEGATVGTNPTLTTVVSRNRSFVAHYAEAHLFHVVTTATLPAGLATVSGAGTYNNGQSTTIAAPAAVTNAPPNYYAFKQFTLNGAFLGTNASFLKTFATTDATNLHYVAAYELVDRTPPTLGTITVTPGVASATLTWTTDEPTTARVVYGLTPAYGATNSVGLLRTQHSFLLTGLAPATLHHFRVRVTDGAGNEAASEDRTFTTLAAPDLVAGALAVPASAQAGTLIPLTFVLTNIGLGPALGPWQNAVLLSPNADGSGAQSLGAVAFNPGAAGLAPGATLTVTQQVIVPAVGTGARYFGILLDSGNQVFELDEANNTAFASAPLNIVATDLRVARVTAPANAAFGQTIAVTFVVTNAGTAAAAVPWVDRLYLSSSSGVLGTLLATADAPQVPLPPGASSTNTISVTLPIGGGLVPGSFHLVLAADHGQAVAESDETNNLGSTPMTLALPPLPDLTVASVAGPANARPGQSVAVVYTVRNQGNANAGLVWSETIYLATDSVGAGLAELATLAFTNTLATSTSVTRTQTVVIPPGGLVGTLWFAVQADSRADVIESNETNNLGVAAQSTLVPAALLLQFSAPQISEGASQPLVATVTRGGSRAAALTVLLDNGDPTELTVPAQVAIPAGQASATFQVAAVLDGVVDGPQTVTVSATAAGYEAAVAQVTVLDVDLPQLTLTMATNLVRESQSLAVVVTRNPGTVAVVVTLSSSHPTQLAAPPTVTIPAGQAGVEFSLQALDDSLVEAPLNVTVSASANGHRSASTAVTVQDDDWPALTLTLAPDVVSEGAGPQAALATVGRNPVSPRALDLELESSNTNALRVPRVVTIPASQTTVAFPVSAVDNDLVDGPKSVEVRVWFRASGSATRLGQAALATITVTDDDGPTLRLAVDRPVLPEGQNPAGTGTLTRNANTHTALVVTLSSDNTNELRVPASVTLPAGAAAANFPLISVDDGVTDGNQVVTLTATAPGFTPGSLPVTVTDVNLPDLVVGAVTAPASAETEAYVDVGYQIRNQGVVASPTNSVVQRIYLSTDSLVGGDVLMGQWAFNGALPAGSQFGQTLPIRMPQAAGDYWVIVETDALNNVVELLENNNLSISTTPIRVAPAYQAVVSTTLEAAPADTPVPLAGQATRAGGLPAAHSLVSIHIRVRGTTRTIAALTDSQGRFATTWQPLPGEAGFYEIAAGHPGVSDPATQDSFYLLGMRAQPATPSVRLSEGSSVGGTVQIENLSDVPLTGLAVELVSKPPNLDVTLTVQTNRLAGLAQTQLAYGISARDASFTWGNIQTRLTSAEGAVLEVLIRVTIDPLVPRLVASPGRLELGMKRGAQRLVSFQIVNTGGLETGPVTVSLPPLPWLSLASPNPLPSMAPGGTNTVTLRLSPPEDIPLALHQGNLAVNGVGTGVAVPFAFRALSEAKGALLISAADEFTYYAAGAPPLTNATVRVRDAVSQTVVTNGVTDTAGRFFVSDLLEGYYDLELDAEQHTGHRSTFFLEPGITNEITAFLSYQAVRYTWTVERIEIEDRYKITIETEFETVVPKPVVTIEPAALDVGDLLVVGQTKQVNLTIRNHGLIAADDTRLRFDSHPFYSIEPLIGDLGRLPAKSTLTIPVTLRRIGDFDTVGGLVRAASGVPCSMGGGLSFEFVCGPVRVGGGAPVAVSGVRGDCGSAGPGIGGIGPGWGGPGGGFGPGGGRGVAPGYSAPSIGIRIGCDPACLVIALAGCVPWTPACWGAAAAGCIYGNSSGISGLGIFDCAVSIVGCAFPPASVPACIYSLLRCFFTPTSGGSLASTVTMASAANDPLEAFKPAVRAQLDAMNLITGAPDGVWLNPAADPTTGEWWVRFQTAAADGSAGGRAIAAGERADLLSGVQPPGVPVAELNRFLDRWNRTHENIALGILRPADAPPGANQDFIDLIALRDQMLLIGAYQEEIEAQGYSDPYQAMFETVRIRSEAGEEGGVCARVKIKLDQEAVLSREAFRATLDIDNATANALEDIRVTVRVTDGTGRDANDLFGIRAPELTGLSDVAGGGRVAGGAKGTARWTLVPTVDAAPLEPTVYYVGGEFRYSLNGLPVTVPLAPVPITVNPTARLTLDYFHQRDVYSDDPFTDLLEPSVPFSLAVMVRNQGAGDARNFRITSGRAGGNGETRGKWG